MSCKKNPFIYFYRHNCIFPLLCFGENKALLNTVSKRRTDVLHQPCSNNTTCKSIIQNIITSCQRETRGSTFKKLLKMIYSDFLQFLLTLAKLSTFKNPMNHSLNIAQLSFSPIVNFTTNFLEASYPTINFSRQKIFLRLRISENKDSYCIQVDVSASGQTQILSSSTFKQNIWNKLKKMKKRMEPRRDRNISLFHRISMNVYKLEKKTYWKINLIKQR